LLLPILQTYFFSLSGAVHSAQTAVLPRIACYALFAFQAAEDRHTPPTRTSSQSGTGVARLKAESSERPSSRSLGCLCRSAGVRDGVCATLTPAMACGWWWWCSPSPLRRGIRVEGRAVRAARLSSLSALVDRGWFRFRLTFGRRAAGQSSEQVNGRGKAVRSAERRVRQRRRRRRRDREAVQGALEGSRCKLEK